MKEVQSPETSGQGSGVGNAMLASSSELQLYYRITIIKNYLKSSWTEVL